MSINSCILGYFVRDRNCDFRSSLYSFSNLGVISDQANNKHVQCTYQRPCLHDGNSQIWDMHMWYSIKSILKCPPDIRWTIGWQSVRTTVYLDLDSKEYSCLVSAYRSTRIAKAEKTYCLVFVYYPRVTNAALYLETKYTPTPSINQSLVEDSSPAASEDEGTSGKGGYQKIMWWIYVCSVLYIN